MAEKRQHENDPDRREARASEPEEEQRDEAREDVEPEIDPEMLSDALTALAELDAQSAAAYSVAAATLEDDETRNKLIEFRGDHQRHVQDLNELIDRFGGRPVREQELHGALLARLAETAATMGDAGVLLAMIGNEQLTNATYRLALALAAPDEVASVIAANFDDEQRHLRWLMQIGAEQSMEEGQAAGERG
jgi:rubrerythrin